MQRFVDDAIGDTLYAKRVLSLSKATTGVIHASALGVNAIGRALALSQNTLAKHGVKQVDRLLSNVAIDPSALFASWVPFVLADRTEARIALDWTHFGADGHATLAAYLITSHGRATPLMWRTFPLAELTDGGRTDGEDLLPLRLRDVVPETVKVTLIADRGFGDARLYDMLERWGWAYVSRFRRGIHVTNAAGETKPVEQWLSPKGHAKALRGASVTTNALRVGVVVTIHANGMSEPWFLATSLADKSARDVVDVYARRFTIEETFRDQKDPRFGLGMSHTRVKSPERRDRLVPARRARTGAAHAPRSRGRTLRIRPHAEDEHLEDPDTLALQAGMLLVRGDPDDGRCSPARPDARVRRGDPRASRHHVGARDYFRGWLRPQRGGVMSAREAMTLNRNVDRGRYPFRVYP